uniref:Uncharacterized protein n=1 Tax=Salmonella sp. 14 TaxID=1179812 RepID=I3W2S6_9ENTR|nr:hypothetical protein [Salmonella sp. 14]
MTITEISNASLRRGLSHIAAMCIRFQLPPGDRRASPGHLTP